MQKEGLQIKPPQTNKSIFNFLVNAKTPLVI